MSDCRIKHRMVKKELDTKLRPGLKEHEMVHDDHVFHSANAHPLPHSLCYMQVPNHAVYKHDRHSPLLHTGVY